MPIAAAENEASESPQFRGVAANKAANQRADAREVAAGTLRSDKGRREKFDAREKARDKATSAEINVSITKIRDPKDRAELPRKTKGRLRKVGILLLRNILGTPRKGD
ncbi:MAG: hypothetical protein M1815_000257 [Lichina confinis]|nr:MAG: hypothetical protein M1815_000257 [Lichina confinis]